MSRQIGRLQARPWPSRGAVALLLAALLALAPTAALALPPIGETPYSGRFTMNAGGQPITGKVFHSRDAERREMTTEGGEQVMILRPREAEALMIMPGAGMALRIPLPPDPGLAASEAFARLNPEEVGEAVVAGEATTIYRTSGEMNGRFWITDDGIVMRMEAEAQQGTFTMELEELNRGEQAPSLFELPPGVKVIDGGQIPAPQMPAPQVPAPQ